MQIYREKPVGLGPSVVTIGTFDGVHQGHQRLIREVVSLAQMNDLHSGVLTFDPLPRSVHRPELSSKLICTVADRASRIASLGVDSIWVQHYDLDFAALSPQDFVEQYLVEPFAPRFIVVGKDTRFGKGNSGDVMTLMQLGTKFGFAVQVIPDIIDPISARRWSSTWVREMLSQGDVDGAKWVLGRPHSVRGRVEHGKRRGRQLGFPTANLNAELIEAIPADGVYAGWLRRPVPHHCENPRSIEILPAAISVGSSPHFADVGRTVEAHVLGRGDLDLYGDEITVEFVHRIRDNRAFDSLEELLARMDLDLEETSIVLEVPRAKRVNPAEVTA